LERTQHGGRARGVEALLEAHAAPAGQPAVDAVREPVHVEEREHREVTVGRGDLPARREHGGVRGEVAPRQHRALGLPGRARRVNQRRDRLAVHRHDQPMARVRRGLGGEPRDVPPRRARGQVCGTVGGRHHDLRGRVGDEVRDLPLAVQRVHRHGDHSQADAREEQVEELDPVREEDREAVAGDEPARRQAGARSRSRARRSPRR
jgi:hypothetical protein